MEPRAPWPGKDELVREMVAELSQGLLGCLFSWTGICVQH